MEEGRKGITKEYRVAQGGRRQSKTKQDRTMQDKLEQVRTR